MFSLKLERSRCISIERYQENDRRDINKLASMYVIAQDNASEKENPLKLSGRDPGITDLANHIAELAFYY